MTVAELRWLGPGDVAAVLAAEELFDEPPTPQWTQEFLSRTGHHLCLAYVDDKPAGFASAVEMAHPDKGTEMFLYELGVAEPFRGHGIGRALVTALVERARDIDCYGMWTLTDEGNEAARRSYGSTGAAERGPQLMLDWRFDGREDG